MKFLKCGCETSSREKKNMKNKFLLCVENKGHEASLEMRKFYESIPDKEAERHNQIRIIDESGENYLYPVQGLGRCLIY